MATKIFCDRCGKEIVGRVRRLVLRTPLAIGASKFHLRADMCEGCSELVVNFVEYPVGGAWLEKLGLECKTEPIRKFKGLES